MLTEVSNTLDFLVELGLIGISDIVDGDLVVADYARRNRNLLIRRRHRPSYLVKRPEVHSRRLFHSEGKFYSLCRSDHRFSEIARLMPELHTYEKDPPLLVLDLLIGCRPLWEELASRLKADPHDDLFYRLGRALAGLHRLSCAGGPIGDSGLDWLVREPPTALFIDQPDDWAYRGLSPGNRRLISIIQQEVTFCDALALQRADWRAESLIHGDIRSDNILILPPSKGQSAELHLVDWESVQLGDPAWDVGSALQDLLLFWILQLPAEKELQASERTSRTERQLELVHRVNGDFWSGYRDTVGMTETTGQTFLGRAVRYTAPLLLQSAFEISLHHERLSTTAVMILQIAANILKEGENAASLFGLKDGGETAADK